MIRTLRLILALTLFLCPARAWAHAHLKRSEPAAGSKVATSPQVIRLWFSEQPELSTTFISLKDVNGKEWVLTGPQNDSTDPLAVFARVSAPLPAGRYTVAWRTAASDGHPSHGTFAFVVLAEAVIPANGVTQQVGGATSDSARVRSATSASSTGGNQEEGDAASSTSNSLARA